MNELTTVTDNGYESLITLSERLAKSGIIPASLRGKPNDIAVILMTGREMNLGPMMSLNLINVIQGRPELSAMGKIAVIKRAYPNSIITITGDERAATCIMARFKEDSPQSITFTIEDARKADLLGRDPWKKFPATMLRWRSISSCARLVFPDVILGIYDADELEDIPKKHLGSKYEPIDIPKVELVHKNKHWNIPNQEVIHNTNQEPKEETKCLDPLPVRQEMSNSGEGKYPIWGWGKWKGKAINEVPLDELSSYIVFLGTKNFDFKKPANKDFFEHVARYLGSNYFMAQDSNSAHPCWNCGEIIPNSATECGSCGRNDTDIPQGEME